MDTMTRGANEAIATNVNAAKFAARALRLIDRKGGFPDMIVGRKTKTEAFEDEGRTLVLSMDYKEKMYVCINETGGATIMLADEY